MVSKASIRPSPFVSHPSRARPPGAKRCTAVENGLEWAAEPARLEGAPG